MDLDKLSTKERTIKDIDPPVLECPDNVQLFSHTKQGDLVIDSDFLRKHFYAEGFLQEEQVLRIIGEGTNLLRQEPNCLELPAPIVIAGDIHGQFYDLLRLFEVAGGQPPANAFLFLGDYVDRGYFSIECFVYLLALKINHPKQVFLLRGNHECRHITKHFTFRLECRYKYSEAVYEACMEAFDALPLAAIVNRQFFCVHGGIGPDLKDAKRDVNAVNRFQEIPKDGLMCDLLWADPTVNYGSEGRAGFLGGQSFPKNTARGCSFRFTHHDALAFLKANNLITIIRGHEAQNDGYRLYRENPQNNFPTLLTLFSAPNYVDVYNNKAAVLFYDGKTFNIRQFTHSPHPYYLPKFMDAFDWSLPFVGQNVVDILLALLNIPSMKSKLSELEPAHREKLEAYKAAKQDRLLSKLTSVTKVAGIMAAARGERETLSELVNAIKADVAPNNTELSLAQEDMRAAIVSAATEEGGEGNKQAFAMAKQCDSINEMEVGDEELKKQDENNEACVSVCPTSPVQPDSLINTLIGEIAGSPAEEVIEASPSNDPIEVLKEVVQQELQEQQ